MTSVVFQLSSVSRFGRLGHFTRRFSTKNLFYNEEQLSIQKTLNKIIENDINPGVDQWEAEGIYPAHEIFKKLGNAGLLGITKPTKYGGLGLDFKYEFAMLEQLGGVNCGAIPMSISVQTDMATPALSLFGSEKLKSDFLVPSIKGDYVACLGVSEPGAGSDVASIKTYATKQGDDLIINGQKMWITNAFQADWICLLANTLQDEKNPHLNKSLICVNMKEPGIELAKKIDKMGMRSSDTGVIYFDNVRVPASNIIGEEGQGFMYQMLQFQQERLAISGLALKPLQNVIDSTIEYTKTRMAFGKPLIDNQVVHFRLAELQSELELLRNGCYKAVEQLTGGEDVTLLASMLKLKSGRLTREITDACLQYWGGMGFTDDVFVSRYFRDGRLGSIGGGSDETMLSIICKYMGILPKPSTKA